MHSLSHRIVFQVLCSHTWLSHWTTQLNPPAMQTVLGSIAAEGSERLSLQNRYLYLDSRVEQPLASGKWVGRRTGRQRRGLAEEVTELNELLCSQNAIVLFHADPFEK